MAVFRIEKTRDYTVMSNHHLRNTDLSLKAKGLLSLMLSLPEDWDYTMKGLARICKDGIDSISGGIRELEAHGYLIRERIRNENGQLGSIEYTILEQPKPPAPMQEPPILEKGTLLPEIGTFLERQKHRIKCLNLINFRKSMKYNPLAYIRSEKDILKLVNALIMNTKGEGDKSGEDFWVKAERLYYSALIGYIWYEAPEEEKNFITLLDLINASEAREDDEGYQSPVDLLFAQLEEKAPDHFAVKQ